MKVNKVMRPEVETCSADAPLSDAAKIMWEQDCGSVPVVEEGRLTGVITDRDIAMAGLMTGLPLGLIVVREVMTAEPVSVAADESLADAHGRMREAQVRRLPVVDEDNAVVGVLSLNDLVNEAFGGKSKAAQKRQRDAAKTLAEICIPHETSEQEQATED